MNLQEVVCSYCGKTTLKEQRRINSAVKAGKLMYCNNSCSNLASADIRLKAHKEAFKSRELDRFWEQVQKTEKCWNWSGTLDKGYGVFCCDGGWTPAHRWSYEHHFGDFDKSLVILHTCDNRRCIRPDHLRLGSTQDNNFDKYIKGRHTKGSDNPMAKLTEEQVLLIRQLASKYKAIEIAKQFNISIRTISAIIQGRTWKHLEVSPPVRSGIRNVPILSDKEVKEFNSLTKRDSADGCWNWTGAIINGYGRYKNFPAHRIAYSLHNQKDDPSLLVCHTCHNPICVNPQHLKLGTVKDNAMDEVVRGNTLKGIKARTAKLTEAQVLEIRRRWEAREASAPQLGKEFGVSPWTIYGIVHHRYWKHI